MNGVLLIVLTLVGLALVAASVVLRREDMWPSVALEMGAGILLFAVLFYVERSFIRREIGSVVEALTWTPEQQAEFSRNLTVDDAERTYASDGPVATALAWTEAMAQRRYLDAWGLSERNWRLCRGQAWLWNNRDVLQERGYNDLEGLAEMLDDGPAEHPLWHEFQGSETMQFADALADLDVENLGVSTRRRVTGIDHELVVLLPLGPHKEGYACGDLLPSALAERLDSPLSYGVPLAGYGAMTPPTPGLPPSWWFIDSADDKKGGLLLGRTRYGRTIERLLMSFDGP